jgi:hypothetical protein
MFAAFAQFELELMLERQRAGIAKAKADGKYKGRKPTARAKARGNKGAKRGWGHPGATFEHTRPCGSLTKRCNFNGIEGTFECRKASPGHHQCTKALMAKGH